MSNMLVYQTIYEIDTGVDVLQKETGTASPSRSPVKHAFKRRSVVLCPVLPVLGALDWDWETHVNILPA